MRVDRHFAAPKPPVDKTFRPFDPDQGLLLPPSLDDWLPAEHLARFIADLAPAGVLFGFAAFLIGPDCSMGCRCRSSR